VIRDSLAFLSSFSRKKSLFFPNPADANTNNAGH